MVLGTTRLRPHLDGMRRNLAEALDVDVKQVSVKARSNDGLGWRVKVVHARPGQQSWSIWCSSEPPLRSEHEQFAGRVPMSEPVGTAGNGRDLVRRNVVEVRVRLIGASAAGAEPNVDRRQESACASWCGCRSGYR